jgi:hypothetical protein
VFATGLSQEARTQGKAAVDVAATQMGKAGGSLFQQALLVAFGSLGGALPALAACHTACVSLWIWAVSSLAHHHGHMLSNLRPRRGVLAAAVPDDDAAVVAEVSYTDGPACDIQDMAALKKAAAATSV